ncbi:uncharacterized protein M421DRAFT_284651 [Didymella exigua CBS 183.55]|uniref:Uncharacterized protein n=1 Tax=Didymella exigua CBS 183.55 TaxID=1150837 RepID=A0A6A5RY24_9PLEO|nr:uncharacterized protein M421DRAFT_284651 [Didymella exigua CBS 183.55]KAF1932114.1 hypothetical protein M421DRAFT_284651 [Didymella exigua CBS 183.55]
MCLRLQNEDHAYIQAFMERHLTRRNNLSWPSQLQRMSPPQMSSSKQQIYKRVTLSSHMTYLKLATKSITGTSNSDLDQDTLFKYQGTAAEEIGHVSIVKMTTSVLLTIALPDASITNQEELDLLKLPQGFWTVMVVNCHERLARDMEREPTLHLTPVAQFLRGLTYSLRTLNLNAEAIYDQLKERLQTSDDESLFDDENFTKSNVYHWTVKTCHELRESLMASQRYVRRTFDKDITRLCEKDAHESERHGLVHWRTEHDAEMNTLEDLVSQIAALNASVQESRNALHGVTAVLETRVALQQGERIKTLAYLATIYLPLTATSSLYSMSVLPSSATFWSFFVVLVAFLLGTAFTALSLKPVVAGFRAKVYIDIPKIQQAPATLQRLNPRRLKPQWLTLVLGGTRTLYDKSGLRDYLRYYADVIRPERDGHFRWAHVFIGLSGVDGFCDTIIFLVFRLPFLLMRIWPEALVREALTREIMFLRDQYYLRTQLERNMPGLWWSPLALVRDVFRVVFVPVWVVFIIAIVGLLVLEDILVGILKVFVLAPFALCRRQRA